jgi:hypothetical protein
MWNSSLVNSQSFLMAHMYVCDVLFTFYVFLVVVLCLCPFFFTSFLMVLGNKS